MNKKQEILDCIKTLNLTQEQANRLADVLAIGGEGGSNKSVNFFVYRQEDALTTFKVNDREIPFTKSNLAGPGKVYSINEQDFNYIKNNIKDCSELQLEMLSGDVRNNCIFGTKYLYMYVNDEMKYGTLERPNYDGGTRDLFCLYEVYGGYYFMLYYD